VKSIAIFADVQNIYYTCKQAYGAQFNYRKLWKQTSELGKIVAATAYAIDKGDASQMKFQSALKHIGFDVKLKPYIQRADGSAKGDWDVGITIDVMEKASEVDMIVLLSGDGDFDLLLQHITAKYQLETHVFGVALLTANSLIQSASGFTEITQDWLL